MAARAARGEAEEGAGGRVPPALPRLHGRRLTAFTILWSLLLPLAVAMPVISVAARVERAETPVWIPLGLAVDSIDGDVHVFAATTREARAAGVRPGDTVVAIDGRKVSGGARGYQEARSRLVQPEGTRFVISLRGADGRIRTVGLTRRRAHIDEPFKGSGLSVRTVSVLGMIGGALPALFFVPAAILLFRRRREAVPALLSLALLLLAAGEFAGTGGWYDLNLPQWSARLVGSAGWTALLIVLLTFPKGDFRPRWTVWLALPLLVWMLLFVSGLILYLLSVGLLVLVMAAAVANLALRYRRMEPGAERQQMRWFLFGFAAGTLSFAVAILVTVLSETLFAGDILATAWLQILFYIFGPLGGVAIACGLLVSLLRYRLYDAEAVISRSAGFAALTLALGAVFAASAKGLETLFELYFGGDAGALPGVIGAGLAVALVTPLHNRIHAWAERRFRKVLLHLRRDLPDCVDDLRETAGLKDLLDEVLARVESGVRAVRSAVTVEGKVAAARGVDADSTDISSFPLAVPLRAGREGVELGTLLVGPRPDGSAPGQDEREALHEVAGPIARAMRVVMLREAKEREIDARFGRMERRLAKALGAAGRRS